MRFVFGFGIEGVRRTAVGPTSVTAAKNQAIGIDAHDVERIGKLERLPVADALSRKHQLPAEQLPAIVLERRHIDRPCSTVG